jgi:hypothetical protein
MLTARGLRYHRRLQTDCFSAFASASCMIASSYNLIFIATTGIDREKVPDC